MKNAPPNVVVLHAHDLGRFLGCYGVATLATPNLDRLAAEGARFTRAQCASPGCSPARAALFTGHYPHTTGVMGLTHGRFGWRMNDRVTHLARHLADAGYHTARAGIFHEDAPDDLERQRERHGFAEIVAEHGARAREVSDSVVDWLRGDRSHDRPFYLQCGFFEPHRVKSADEAQNRRCLPFVDDKTPAGDPDEPVQVPGFLEDCAGTREELREIQAAVRQLDGEVGRILDALEGQGLADNTLLVFTTDHGLALPRAKSTLYEPGVEVALMMRFPAGDGIAPGERDGLVSHVDVTPTILDRVGVALPGELAGDSLMPLLRGATEGRREWLFAEKTYHDHYDPKRSARDERYKLIANFSHAPSFADSSQAWQPRAWPSVPTHPALAYTPDFELYDLVEDPWEQRNLAEAPEHADTLERLVGGLGHWMRETADPLLDGPVPTPAERRVRGRLARSGESRG